MSMLSPYLFLTSGLGLGLISVIFSNDIFALGIWTQAEPVIGAVHLAGALCFAGLAWHWKRNGLPKTWLRSPTFLAPLSLAIWNLLCSLGAQWPLQSILGPPQTGEGAIWYLDLTAFILAASHLRQDSEKTFRWLVWFGAGIVLIIGVFNIFELWPPLITLSPVRSIGRFFGGH